MIFGGMGELIHAPLSSVASAERKPRFDSEPRELRRRARRVEPARLNVTVSVGTRVPDSVHFYPLPVEVFVVYPEWRGYDYILVGYEILVIDPRTHQIVAILEA